MCTKEEVNLKHGHKADCLSDEPLRRPTWSFGSLQWHTCYTQIAKTVTKMVPFDNIYKSFLSMNSTRRRALAKVVTPNTHPRSEPTYDTKGA